MSKPQLKRINQVNSSEFELVKVVSDNPQVDATRQGITKVSKDDNGLLLLNSIELNDNNQMIERVRLTAHSLNRALIENISASNIALIDQIIKAVIADAQNQADKNTRQHLSNRLGQVGDMVASYKQNNIEVMKQYLVPQSIEGDTSIWDSPINFYCDENTVENNNSSASIINAVAIEDEEQDLNI